MHRRDLLSILGGAAAASVLAPLSPEERMRLGRGLHASLAASPGPLAALTASQAALVDQLAELILPATDTPGAREVGVLAFIDRILAFWDTAEERDGFLAGLAMIEDRARAAGAPFAELSEAKQTELLTGLDRASSRTPGTAEAAWSRLKSMAVYGYFTSRQVQQEVLKTVLLPGRFDGCIPAGGPA